MLSVFFGIMILIYSLLLYFPWKIQSHSSPVIVSVEKGMSPWHIAKTFKKAGIIPSEKNFIFCTKITGSAKKLKAGQYQFSGWLNNKKILHKLSKGRIFAKKITIPEGIRASKIASILHQNMGLDSTAFMQLITDTTFCSNLGIKASNLEGYLYPNTYYFDTNTTPENVIKHLITHFHTAFSDSLKARAEELDFNIHEVMTLASIVEGEAAVGSEREIISALYQNRINRRMRLQADPTIQFIIADGPRRLLTRDLEIDSPYNTYLYSGLPPGPVNNPGLASIKSVLYPADVNYLYMVANGDGSHTFSRTMSDHLKAKQKFDRYRRKIRRLKY